MPRPVADDARRIEARQLPPPGGRVGLRWGDVASAMLERDGDAVMIAYRWRDDPGERWRETKQMIRLTHLACHFGGHQTFFVCPSCQRRAYKLYHHPAGEDAFLCRRCGGLVPRAQSEGSWQRALRRASKIRRYCGGDGSVGLPFPPRPRGMTERTYRALREEALALEGLPVEAWIGSGTTNLRLGVRRDQAKRRWWPGRNAESREARHPRQEG